ncbi:MAG: type II 3-dehydroquinate dehydratase [Nitrospira bacterium HGW-Nitrospira-1]|nr:MAG: type II 3-dehydroquinate dehydratase [Nitrospira bacterium HGW-Nitrospira-1]
MKILVVHGPNLNLLGSRESGIYGHTTLADLNKQILDLSKELGMDAEVFQSNSEGAIVDAIQTKEYDVLIINPAAYTHTSVAIRDSIAAVGKPAIEVHISNIYKREEFRKKSFISGVAVGQISGLGTEGYLLAVRAAKKITLQ